MIGETLSVARGSTDKKANRETTSTHTITGVIGWGTWSPNRGERAESAKGDAELYVAKGVDLRTRDRVTRSSGQTFAVVAGPLWDQPHPMSGRHYGWSVFTLHAMSG